MVDMLRSDVENKSLSELLSIINDVYGKTRGNDLVARESFRIISKALSASKILEIKIEAAKRVLSGQVYRKKVNIEEELKNILNSNDIDYD